MRTLARNLFLFPTAAFLVTLATLACKGGGQEADLTVGEITDEQLALMVLALEDFGPDANFQADEEDNGFTSAEEEAADDFDPADEAQDLERFGWASGYDQLFLNHQAAEDLSGLFIVGSNVDLFDTQEGAIGYFDDSKTELLQLVGTTDDGTTVEEAEPFDADIGDEAIGFHLNLRIQNEDGSSFRAYFSGVVFRHGRLLGGVFISAFEERRLEVRLRDLTHTLDQRILSVLRGEV